MTAPAAPAPEPAALWEDFLEIFIKPAAVFERRKAAGFAMPLLVLTLLFGLIFFGLRGAFQPIMDAENARAIAKVMAKNPQITEEMMAERTATGAKLAPIIVTIAVPVTVLLIGLATWLGGKLAGAAVSMGAAMMIATYSFFPRVLELLVSGAQALLLPEEQLTGRASTSLGLARGFDPDTASSMLMAVLLRVDVFTLWITFLVAVGLRVVGKVPMGKALIGAAVVWVLGALPTLLGALMSG
ncbi:MAG TPA: YIP1 family protein [Gemmatimonadales bacterium]|nr:YIP1 family protein [Gemmatimonadales bacterium]